MITKSDVHDLMERFRGVAPKLVSSKRLDSEARAFAAKHVASYMLVLGEIVANESEKLSVELAPIINLAVEFVVKIENFCNGVDPQTVVVPRL